MAIKKPGVWITGVKQVTNNLNSEIRKIKFRSSAGVAEAGLLVRGEAQKLTPVVTGNLRNSAYTSQTNTVKGPAAEIGFTAIYSKDVHENMEKEQRRQVRKQLPAPDESEGRLKFSRVGQWKFLETALKMNTSQILDIIRKRVHR